MRPQRIGQHPVAIVQDQLFCSSPPSCDALRPITNVMNPRHRTAAISARLFFLLGAHRLGERAVRLHQAIKFGAELRGTHVGNHGA